MSYIPTDTWFTISLHLPPRYLSIVNKQLSELYNEHWYKEYLIMKCPHIDFSCQHNYEGLTNRYHKQGNIYERVNDNVIDLDIRGIKAYGFPQSTLSYDIRKTIYLDFMGILCIHTPNKVIEVDVDVVDMCNFVYIKERSVHLLCVDRDEYFCDLLLQSESGQFTHVTRHIHEGECNIYVIELLTFCFIMFVLHSQAEYVELMKGKNVSNYNY